MKIWNSLMIMIKEMTLKWQVSIFHENEKFLQKRQDRKLQFDCLRNQLGLTKTNVECVQLSQDRALSRECRSNGGIVGGEMLGTLGIRKKTIGEDLVNRRTLKLCSCSDTEMSSKDKAGLGYGNQMNKGVLSYENEVFQSVFVSRTSETENSPMNDRYAKGMHVVPPPMTVIYIPSGLETEIDDSQFTYGPKQSKPSEYDARSSDFTSCESNTSEETHESMPETVVNEPTVVSQPKVWNYAHIIEEYESDSEDEHVSLPSKEQETPSFANT
ncbi:hypothetical protein Tco_0865836, partial [Tanacetum coccineum]